ncbi:hypothetical protein [Streptomyces sampsonii]|uniref:hypothetical protein n=1 Tax=Streptomyces sampsonii TaxID=42239 RepID=UPI0008F5234C|nr:hypothetical protein [Streptomyces sampsonii]
MSALLTTAGEILLAAPDPTKGGGNPPGWDKLLTLLHWVFLVVTVLLVTGVLLVAGRMAIAYQRGEAGEHGTRLGVVCFACILAASASGLVTVLTA